MKMNRGGAKTPLQCALRYLGFRARTESEMRQKLMASGFLEEQVQSTLEELKAKHLINDESLARDWTQRKTVEHGYGPLFVARELHRRGVAVAVVERVLSETFGQAGEVERATEVLGQRFGKDDLSDVKTLKRAEALLYRRGYHPEVIAQVLGEKFQEVEG